MFVLTVRLIETLGALDYGYLYEVETLNNLGKQVRFKVEGPRVNNATVVMLIGDFSNTDKLLANARFHASQMIPVLELPDWGDHPLSGKIGVNPAIQFARIRGNLGRTDVEVNTTNSGKCVTNASIAYQSLAQALSGDYQPTWIDLAFWAKQNESLDAFKSRMMSQLTDGRAIQAVEGTVNLRTYQSQKGECLSISISVVRVLYGSSKNSQGYPASENMPVPKPTPVPEKYEAPATAEVSASTVDDIDDNEYFSADASTDVDIYHNVDLIAGL